MLELFLQVLIDNDLLSHEFLEAVTIQNWPDRRDIKCFIALHGYFVEGLNLLHEIELSQVVNR